MATAVELPNPLLMDFWVRDQNEINADLDTLRAAGGITFHDEPPVPEDYPLETGPRLLGSHQLRRRPSGIEATGDLLVGPRHHRAGHADGVRRVLQFHDS